MINFKQEELIRELFEILKTHFPEITYLGVTRGPEDTNDVWLNVTAPKNEDREIALIELAAEKTTDILLEYGYDICLMPRNPISDPVKQLHSHTLMKQAA